MIRESWIVINWVFENTRSFNHWQSANDDMQYKLASDQQQIIRLYTQWSLRPVKLISILYTNNISSILCWPVYGINSKVASYLVIGWIMIFLLLVSSVLVTFTICNLVKVFCLRITIETSFSRWQQPIYYTIGLFHSCCVPDQISYHSSLCFIYIESLSSKTTWIATKII